MLLDYHEEPQNNLRAECKRVIRVLMESHKEWKSDVMVLKKSKLDKIDRILKGFGQGRSSHSHSNGSSSHNAWIENENV